MYRETDGGRTDTAIGPVPPPQLGWAGPREGHVGGSCLGCDHGQKADGQNWPPLFWALGDLGAWPHSASLATALSSQAQGGQVGGRWVWPGILPVCPLSPGGPWTPARPVIPGKPTSPSDPFSPKNPFRPVTTDVLLRTNHSRRVTGAEGSWGSRGHQVKDAAFALVLPIVNGGGNLDGSFLN